jgi:hypothetical protein
MRLFVCQCCGNTVEDIGSPESFRINGAPSCGTCGGPMEEGDLSEAERAALQSKHQRWTWRAVLGFEAVFWVLCILALAGSLARG